MAKDRLTSSSSNMEDLTDQQQREGVTKAHLYQLHDAITQHCMASACISFVNCVTISYLRQVVNLGTKKKLE